MYQPSRLDPIPEPDPSPESRGRGFAAQVSAEALWHASIASQPAAVRRRARWRYLLYGERPEPIPSHRGPVRAPGATGICCSGGGIRSAAYNLGALQALQREDRLHSADYLAAVSGGSYIAAAFCMVGKTSDDPADDDSDPELIARTPPFAPGTPEEQYLRNRSSYIAPDARAKAYVGLRLLLGLTYNVVFLALPIIGLMILAGVFLYVPYFGGLENGLHPAPAAWLIPAAVAAGGIAIGGLRLLRRPPTAAARGFSESWSVRLLFGGALVAILTLVLPALVDAVHTTEALGVNGSSSDVGAATGGAGIAGLFAGLLASLRQMFSSPTRLAGAVSKARGRMAKLNKRTRRLVVAMGAIVAGPLLLVTIAVAALNETADQARAHNELWLTLSGCAMLALFALLYVVSDLTTWSLHPFYKRRLSSAFALKRVRPDESSSRAAIAQDHDEGIAVERDFDRLLPLSETACANGPTLVVCAAANISDPGATAPGRRVTSFTFSAETIGGPLVGGLSTKQFESAYRDTRRQGDLTLPAAIAMSGAALSPSMGKSANRSFRFLMTLANIRLGVWVPNPRWVAGFADHDDRKRYKRPRPWYLVKELLGCNRVDAKYLYVTDGGHYENLGLVELLRRGCTTVYCFDASGGQTFAELGDAIALARSELGVQIDIEPTPLMPAGDPPTAQAPAVTGTITYPCGTTGVLVYARNVVAPDAPWDVRAHQRQDPSFPHDTTLDQLYTDQKFESYRALGEYAGEHAMALMDGCESETSAPGASLVAA